MFGDAVVTSHQEIALQVDSIPQTNLYHAILISVRFESDFGIIHGRSAKFIHGNMSYMQRIVVRLLFFIIVISAHELCVEMDYKDFETKGDLQRFCI